MLCWFSASQSLKPGSKLLVRHGTREAQCKVVDIPYRVDVNTLHRDEDAAELKLNDVGRVRLRVSRPLPVDPYRRNRHTGAVVLIDPFGNDTVGGGMIRG